MRVAVVDIGTNSTRLLVADVAPDGAVTELERRSTVTRLGQGLGVSGSLAPEAMERVFTTLAEYRLLIETHAATADAIAILTSASRDAANGAAFTARVRDEFGLDARVISGDQEAQLTYLGATSERPLDAPGPVAVLDIGGGSTEFVVGDGPEVAFHVSTQAGTVRHGERHVTADPPPPDELQGLAADARDVFATAIPEAIRSSIAAGVAVAGTATQVAALDLELEPYDPAAVHGHILTLPRVQELLARLALLPVDERRAVPGMHPDRAPTIVVGLVLLVEALRLLELEEIEISEHDVLRGAALRHAAG